MDVARHCGCSAPGHLEHVGPTYPLQLLVSVPDVRRKLPLVSDLLPYDDVFPDYLLALLASGHQGEGSDLPGGVAAERLYVYRRQLEIAHSLASLRPERLNIAPALGQLAARRQEVGLLGV